MVNKQLADWIKSEEAHGYSETQLRKYLIQQGYNKKDIEDAIKSLSQTEIKFSLVNYVKTISIPLFLVFILSFIFLSYSFDKLLEGIILLVILGVFAFIIDILYKKNKSTLAKWIAGLSLIVLIFYSFNFEVLYSIIMFVLIAIHSLTYFFKSKKKYPLESIFLTLLISLTFSFAISFLVYLIYAYGIFALIGTIQAFILNLVMFPLFIIFIVSYFLISIKLLKKSTDEFDYVAYFRFKHFPFSMLNILSSKEENIRKSIIKSTAILSILLLLIGLVTTAILGISFVNNTYSGISDAQEDLSSQIQYSHDRYEKIIESKGFYEETRINRVFEKNGEFLYLEREFEDVNRIFFNCDTNLNCQQKSFNPNQKIENQVSLSGFNAFLIAENETGKSIFLLPTESYDEIISHNVFEFEDAELQNTQISNEINTQWQSIHRGIINREIIAPKSWQEKLSFFYTGKAYDDVIDYILFVTNLGLSLSDIRQSMQIVPQEYKWINENAVNNTPFYDGTQTIQEHIQKLQNNINQIYPKLSESKQDEEGGVGTIMSMGLFDEQGSLFDKASDKIYKHLDIYKAIERLGSELSEIRQNFQTEKINQDYDKRNIQESDTNKILRLKIVETKIANKVIRDCKTNECKMQIISLTKNPKLCTQLDYNERDQCIIDYSIYDKKICEEIREESLKNDCLNK